METKKRRPGETGRWRREVPGAVVAGKREAGFVREAREFAEDWSGGGVDTVAVRAAYADLLRKAKPNEKRNARELRAARVAFDEALARPFAPLPEGEYRGLRFLGGGIQWPEGTAVDVEVYDAAGRPVGTVTGRATEADGFTEDEARTINAYLLVAGARVA